MFLLILEKHQLVASCTRPNRGLNSQPRYAPSLGIKHAIFLMYGTMLQPTKPPGQGQKILN